VNVKLIELKIKKKYCIVYPEVYTMKMYFEQSNCPTKFIFISFEELSERKFLSWQMI